ncbi:hypothetical protein DTO166G4_7857 [Paecilomyces variotii]|uniref:Cytochrome P450 n=1 Tax=Byssochlamys spectabilis TaxID=264951 RepID=A0A443HY44_BYSSP|nr:cytochrome P450 [Paecilomyces variotii]KAJ9210545.1 hypothetical protein DTO166G4_7857 [Paecilomyces variotii]KAJ9228879.1 hypothetical protein DTO166G5_8279 [Paecilomyces variotii]KAJ9260183.1 hypothetical protein DTO195F2_4627 [Paecilomyces variotii]KAJ9298379.1 hypothetical protein DTO217A2_8404 [Paecilomyces variotii]KAJ9350081.1 hypothetical protein DTO280E4_8777 [Paecilomyces variotii]
MGLSNPIWAILSFSLGILLVQHKPEYSVRESYFLTALSIFFTTLVGRIVYTTILYPEFFTPLRHIQTPKGRSWLKGNTQSLFIESPGSRCLRWMEEMPDAELIRYYLVGNMERVLVVSPKALSEVLTLKSYDFRKPDLARISLERITGNGVLLAEGDEHKRQRKNLMPAFSYRHVKNLYPVFWAKAVEMVQMIGDELRSKPNSQEEEDDDDKTIIVGDWASRATLDAISIASMGRDFDTLRDPDNELNNHYRRLLMEPSVKMRILFLVAMFLVDLGFFQKIPIKRNRDVRAASSYIRTVARQLVREKKERLEKKTQDANGNANTNDAVTAASDEIDIMSVALTSGGFSEENLVDQMMTFLAAGHETTASAFQWVIYALCKHPGIQSRLRDEIRANLPSPSHTSNTISASIIDSLPYLNAVCNETLRFYPSVPLTIREAARDTTVVGHHIPKGSLLVLAPEATNRSKELWGPDADVFDPERWMGPGRANTGGADTNYAFLSFLHGPRGCIGQGFAKGELACMVAVTVGRFQMELKNPDAELKMRRGVTVSPIDGVEARFRVVEGW